MKDPAFLRVKSFNLVSLETAEPEKVLNLVQSRQIGVWDATYAQGRLSFKVMNSQISEVSSIASRFSSSVRVDAHLGLQRIMDRLWERRLFCLLLAGVGGFILFFSTYVWRIEVYGSRLVNEDAVKMFLYDSEVRPSMKKSDIDLNGLEVSLLTRYPEFSGVSAQITGTTLKISVVEREAPLTVYDKSMPVNLVADKDCTLDEFTVYSGTAVAKAGQSVKKGDLLVSSAVKYTYKGQVSYTAVHAMAKILTHEEISFNTAVDIYEPAEGVEFVTQRTYHVFGRSYSTTGSGDVTGMIPKEKKNQVLSLGWIETPILYDEIRWYNVHDCKAKTDDEIDAEIYKAAEAKISPKQKIRSVSRQPLTAEDNRVFYAVVVSVSTNVATEQEFR